MKGTIQMDYAFSIFIFIIMFSILMYYNTQIVQQAGPVVKNDIYYSQLIRLNEILFENGLFNETTSTNMLSKVYIAYVNVSPTEEKNLSIELRFPSSIYKNSIRVYDENLTEVPSNVTYFNSGDFNVTIRTTGGMYIVEASDNSYAEPTYGVDISSISTGSYTATNYTSMYVFDENKFNSLPQNYQNFTNFTGIKHFLITLYLANHNETFGGTPFSTGDVYSLSVSVISINSTGSLERGNVNVKVW